MRIKTKLTLTTLLIAILGAIIGIVGFVTNQSTVASYTLIAKSSSPRIILLNQISYQSNRIQNEALSASFLQVLERMNPIDDLVEEEEIEEEANEMEAAFRLLLSYINALQSLPSTGAEQVGMEQVTGALDRLSLELIAVCREMSDIADLDTPEQRLSQLKEQAELLEEQLNALIEEELSRERALLDLRTAEVERVARQSELLIAGITVLAISLALLVSTVFARAITRPLARLKQLTTAVGQGDLDYQVQIDLQDEIGQLGLAFETMAHDLKVNLQQQERLQEEANKAELERRRLFELERLNRELEQFAYIASHDLKAPLINISNVLTMMEMEGNVHPQNQPYLQDMREVIEAMRAKMATLSKVMRVKKSLELPAEEVLLPQVTEAVMQSLSTQIAESGAQIRVDFTAIDKLQFPALHLHHILSNLLSNALKYRREGIALEVLIATAIEQNFICLSVKDNGRGIDLDAYGEKLFGLFQRFHLELPGEGIGLHLVKNIIEAYQGRVAVDSSPGQGTTFKLYIPFVLHNQV